MKEKEFIKRLTRKLRSIPGKERREIAADYTEHFRVGRQNGKSDHEIVEQLGDPDEIAQAFLTEEYSGGSSERGKASPFRIVGSVFVTIALVFFNLIVILGPFISIAASLIAMWAVTTVFFYSGWQLLFEHTSIVAEAGFPPISRVFGALGLFSLGLFWIALNLFLSRGFFWITGKYFQLNTKLVRKVKGVS